ncbi:MAG: hypothetical protein AB1640_25260 [bacterium]
MISFRRRHALKSPRSSLAALGALAALAGFLAPGCGGDSTEEIIITLTPWTLDFDAADTLYMVERESLSVWKFIGEDADPDGQLLPPAAGGFSPWGIDAGDENSLFVTDVSEAQPRLLALSAAFTDAVVLGPDTLLAETGEGPPGQAFASPPVAVESLPLPGSDFRVFLATGSSVIFYHYDTAAAVFAYEQTLTGGCGHPFQQVQGLAVDALNRRLYVTDAGANDRLYQFSGLNGLVPVCDGEIAQWEDPATSTETDFSDPEGVTVRSGRPAPQDNKVVVADADLVAFYWDGATLQPTTLPEGVEPSPRKPFDVAFDADGELWITYP